MKTKALAETRKHWSSKWFSENVGNIIIGRYTLDVHEALLHDVVYGVVFDTDVLNISVMGGVFGEPSSGIIITAECCASIRGEAKPLEEFPEKDDFLASMMESNVFSIARGIGSMFLFLRAPKNDPRAKGIAVPTNGPAYVMAVGVVSIRAAGQSAGIVAKDQCVCVGTLNVAKDPNGGIPVFLSIAVQEGG